MAVIALALAGASVLFVLSKNPSAVPHRFPSPVASQTVPPTPAFAFTEAKVRALRSEPGVPTGTASSVLDAARTSLTNFYALTLTTPSAWTNGAPDGAWDAFAPAARRRARDDATSLALGKQLPGLASLRVTSATLDVAVLIDPSGHAQAATAVVSVRADGLLADGRSALIALDASFVLRRLDRRWLITGWPAAKLSMEPVPSSSPTPAPGPSATAGASGAAPSPEASS